MEKGLKERLVGAAVLIILAVIFIPMLLDNTETEDIVITETNIPPTPEAIPSLPEDNDFSTRIIPLQQQVPLTEADETESEPVAAETVPAEPAPVEKEQSETTVSQHTTAAQTSTTAVIKSEEAPTNVGLSAWVVQLGSFSDRKNAESLNKQLREAGFRSFVEPLKQKNSTVYRVRVGPELKRSDADAINAELKKTMKLDGIVVHYP